jgi:hypothetical protein
MNITTTSTIIENYQRSIEAIMRPLHLHSRYVYRPLLQVRPEAGCSKPINNNITKNKYNIITVNNNNNTIIITKDDSTVSIKYIE